MASADTFRLKHEVERALQHDPQVGARRIEVQVIENQVILTGVVDTLAQREAAARTALSVTSEGEAPFLLENKLTVESPRGTSDRELEQALAAALAAVPRLPPDAVGARVEDGVAFLVGHVESDGQIADAMAAARRVPGLKGVASQVAITTGAPPDPADLINRVKDALGRDPGIEHRRIMVDADPKGIVTLTGELLRSKERDAAARVARAVPGVHQVINRLRIQEA